MRLPPGRRAARVGIVVLLALWGVLVGIEWARASEVPPLIRDAREAVRDVRRMLGEEDRTIRESRIVPASVELVCEGGPLLTDEGEDTAPTVAERRVIARQVETCMRHPGDKADVWGLLMLWRLEAELGVPDEARGILGAIYCVEAGAMSGQRRGDWRGGVAKAHGPFQLWPSIRRWCGLGAHGADDLETAARCYWARAEDRRQVRALGCRESWRVGEALAANGPYYLTLGCRARSGHWLQMEAQR